jgi:CheY-like chemotaxis protein
VTEYIVHSKDEFPYEMTILVVEDNPILQKVIGLWIHQLGYNSLIVSNSLEFFAKFDPKKHKIIIIDICLLGSNLNGLEIAEKVREKEKGTDNCAIIIANTTNDQLRERCLSSGFDYFLPKDGTGTLKSLGEVLEKCLIR